MNEDIVSDYFESSQKESFLALVARDLRNKYGNDLSKVVVVFPNKRASLFLNKYLIENSSSSESTIWAPTYQSISELFRSFSSYVVADRIDVICRIYNHYIELTEGNESLDYFYGWGERLLADFDDVDKNLVNPEQIFTNWADIKQLENIDYIDARQEEVIQNFFKDFSIESNSQLRQRFLVLWKQLLPLYRRLKEELFSEGIAYEGALYREVVERLQTSSSLLENLEKHYVFVGFNALNKVEEQLFSLLQKTGRASFYWDYDIYYTKNNLEFEAGFFLKKHLKRFPNELKEEHFDNLSHQQAQLNFEVVSAPSDSAQAKSAKEWLENQIAQTNDLTRTAVILCDERLLQPLLYSIPQEITQVNITKGYPLTQTNAYAQLSAMLSNVGDKINEKVSNTLKNLSEALFQKSEEEAKDLDDSFEAILQNEANFLCYTLINRLQRLASNNRLNINHTTLKRLIKQLANQQAIPFKGEPAAGVQIMGLLETRCLDFDNLLILSSGEGSLPTSAVNQSFIPLFLRNAYGMTTSKHRTALTAYYFIRLLQRSKHVRVVYNSTTEGLTKGEMSRFITQLLTKNQWKINAFQLRSHPRITKKNTLKIEKPSDISSRIKRLSPSEINTYLRCPIQFYLQKIKGIKTPEPPAGVIEPNQLGSIFHKAIEIFYKKCMQESGTTTISKEQLTKYLDKGNRKILELIVKDAFSIEDIKYNIIVSEVVIKYLISVIQYDISITPFEIIGLEYNISYPLKISYDKEHEVDVQLKGQIDRIDKILIEGRSVFRVVDYKTGGSPEKANDVESLFIPGEKHPHYILQTCLYAYMIQPETNMEIVPSIFYVHKTKGKDFTPYPSLGKNSIIEFKKHSAEFEDHLKSLIGKIFDTRIPFAQTIEPKFCKNCSYADICKHL